MAIERLTIRGVVLCNGFALSVSFYDNPFRENAVFGDQVILNGIGSFLGKTHVVIIRAFAVCMTGNGDLPLVELTPHFHLIDSEL
jgi:hypothetical protein